MKHFLAYLFLATGLIAADYYPDASRIAPWAIGTTVGVIGGIPTREGATEISVTLYGWAEEASGATNAAAFQSALAASNSGDVITIPAGTFQVTSLNWDQTKPNRTVRGAGMNATILKCSPAGSTAFTVGAGVDYGSVFNPETTVTSMTSGSATVTLTDGSAFPSPSGESQYQLARLSIGPDGTTPVWHSKNIQGMRSISVILASRSGNNVTFTQALPSAFTNGAAGTQLEMAFQLNYTLYSVSVEDLTIDGSDVTTMQRGLQFQHAFNSWIKGVKVLGQTNFGIVMSDTVNCEMRDCYTYGGRVLTVSGITRSGTIATATTTVSHDYTTGNTVEIVGATGADASLYNGTYAITVTGSTTFTYTMSGTPTGSATGSMTAEKIGGGTNRAGVLYEYNSNGLVEDNIMVKTYPNIEVNFGCTGNVFAYNYWDGVAITNHGAHNSFNLYEGNRVHYPQSDGYHGSESEATFYRNLIWAGDVFVSMKRFSRNFNLIGNISGVVGGSYSTNGSEWWGTPNIGNNEWAGGSTVSWQLSDSNYSVDWDSSTGRGYVWTGTLSTRTDNNNGVITITGGASMAAFNAGIALSGLDDQGNPGRWLISSDFGIGVTGVSGSDVTVRTSQNDLSLPTVSSAVTILPGFIGFQEKDLDVVASLVLKANHYIYSGSAPAGETAIGSDTLANSYFRSAKPDYFGDLSWPPYNSLDPQTYDGTEIPAGYRYINGNEDYLGGGGAGSGTMTATNTTATNITVP